MSKLFLAVLMLVGITFAYADYPIAPNQIPANSKQFLSQHFKQEATFAKKDLWEYEVYLQDGTRVEFTGTGAFKEAKGFNLPSSILPKGVQNTIQKQYQGQALTKVEVEYFGYSLEFNDFLEVKITSAGMIIHQKID